MQINIRQLETGGFSREKSLDFTCDLDLSGVKLWGHRPWQEPIRVVGAAKSHLGIITMHYTASYTLRGICARCLDPVVESGAFAADHTVMDRIPEEDGDLPQEPDDQFVLARDGVVDLSELVTADLLLSREGVTLCTEDCRGLCPVCGANMNSKTCPCSRDTDQESVKKPDSRFAALLEFMEENNE